MSAGTNMNMLFDKIVKDSRLSNVIIKFSENISNQNMYSNI